MGLLTQNDLQYKDYYWRAREEHDNPSVIGFPDNVMLATHEGYEVLYFINVLARLSNWTTKAPALKTERMLRQMPQNFSYNRRLAHQWIADNWKNFQ